MRGVQGSILGMRLQDPYLVGCLNEHNELLQISYSQSKNNPGCKPLTLQDLRPPARQQVANGLPGGSLDDAIKQLHNLAHDSLLPPCPPRAPTAGGPVPGGETPPPPPASGVPHLPTLTNLPSPPPEPGSDCRAAA
jgi:protein phosphatase